MYNLSISHINSDMASITNQISRLRLRIRNTVAIGLLSFRGTIQSYSEVSIYTLYKSGTVCLVKSMGIQIFDMEMDRRRDNEGAEGVSVVFYLHLPKSQSHTKLLAQLSYSQDVRAIDEV